MSSERNGLPNEQLRVALAAHKWEFKPRFRRHAFGWKSQPAIARIKQAVAEIKKVAKKDPTLAAEGAVVFLERVSPALEHVDSSSGSIGAAVSQRHRGAGAAHRERAGRRKERATPGSSVCSRRTRPIDIPYIERLADHWGELCASKEVASTGRIG